MTAVEWRHAGEKRRRKSSKTKIKIIKKVDQN